MSYDFLKALVVSAFIRIKSIFFKVEATIEDVVDEFEALAEKALKAQAVHQSAAQAASDEAAAQLSKSVAEGKKADRAARVAANLTALTE